MGSSTGMLYVFPYFLLLLQSFKLKVLFPWALNLYFFSFFSLNNLLRQNSSKHFKVNNNLAYSGCWQTPILSSSKRFPSVQSKIPYPLSSFLPFSHLPSGNHQSASMDLSILGISYKWNNTWPLCLASFN